MQIIIQCGTNDINMRGKKTHSWLDQRMRSTVSEVSDIEYELRLQEILTAG